MSKLFAWKDFALHCLSPEGYELGTAWQVSWLAEPLSAFPPRRAVARGKDKRLFTRLTVAGTATDLHRIPF